MGGVLHVIPQLSGGGGGRSALTAAMAARNATGAPQTIASLRPAAPTMALGAGAAAIELIDSAPVHELHEAIAGSDLVHLHLWNTPELVELLESDLPPCRLLVWPHVAGHTPPQVIDPTLVDRATLVVATSTRSAEVIAHISGEAPPEVIVPVPGWERVEGVTRAPTGGFNVGYIGTVGMIRLHPDFLRMSAEARIPEARFIVCGDGDAARSLPRQAEEIGAGERFDFRGYIDRIGEALAEFDVFGYPIRPGTSASSDLNVKEAMYAGVPPVVLAHGGADDLVEDGVTGRVAATPDDYPRLLERLHADPAERSRLGGNARRHAAERWSPSAVAPLWGRNYERALGLPSRSGPVLDAPDPELSPAVGRFVRGLGEYAAAFEASLRGTEEERIEADRRIEDCRIDVAITDGGLLDYRRRFPNDPTLARWTALALRGAGRPALAEAELHRARQLGAAA
jgi:glycosyltransferase involved in cell wall biosynthesis